MLQDVTAADIDGQSWLCITVYILKRAGRVQAIQTFVGSSATARDMEFMHIGASGGFVRHRARSNSNRNGTVKTIESLKFLTLGLQAQVETPYRFQIIRPYTRSYTILYQRIYLSGRAMTSTKKASSIFGQGSDLVSSSSNSVEVSIWELFFLLFSYFVLF